MKIAVLNKKGGVGKTPIAFTLAKDLGFYLLSNDDSTIEDIYPNMARILHDDEMKEIDDAVYDFGGFTSHSAIRIIKDADLVIVPVFADIDALKRTIKTIVEVEKIAKKIIVIGTKTEKEGDFQMIEAAINKYFPSVEVFELKKSRIMSLIMETGLSVNEYVQTSKLLAHASRGVIAQYNVILDRVKAIGGVK